MFVVTKCISYCIRRKKCEKQMVFDLVEKIVSNLEQYQQQFPNEHPFIPMRRLRDELIPPMERKSELIDLCTFLCFQHSCLFYW